MGDERTFSGSHSDLTGAVLDCFYRVANELGFGFLESVYRRAMMIALRTAGIKAEEEVAITVYYCGEAVGTFYADIVVEGVVILELKAADEITRTFELQLLHYLRASTMEVGMVLAFGKSAKFKRAVMTAAIKQARSQEKSALIRAKSV